MVEKIRSLPDPLSNKEALQFSGPVQVDVAAGVEEVDEVGGGGLQRCRCVA